MTRERLSVAPARTAGCFRVASVNLWGFFGDWPARRKVLVSNWPGVDADVVALQEARLLGGTDQVEELARELRYSELARDPLRAAGQDHEGVAIMSRLPLSETLPIPLPTPGGRRVALRVAVLFPSTRVDVVVAHTSVLAPALTLQLRVLSGLAGTPLVLAGDLNAEPSSTRPILEAAGIIDALRWDEKATWPVDEQAFRGAYADAFGGPPQFPVLPRRLDYVLTRGLRVAAAGVTVFGDAEHGFCSDHAIVWADLCLDREPLSIIATHGSSGVGPSGVGPSGVGLSSLT